MENNIQKLPVKISGIGKNVSFNVEGWFDKNGLRLDLSDEMRQNLWESQIDGGRWEVPNYSEMFGTDSFDDHACVSDQFHFVVTFSESDKTFMGYIIITSEVAYGIKRYEVLPSQPYGNSLLVNFKLDLGLS